MAELYECTAPRPDSRHATATYKGQRVAVDVMQDVVREGSHIVVVVADPARGGQQQLVEYVTDYAGFDEALSAGFDIARALIDRTRH